MIHQYRNNGYDIVLDVNSGSVHVVDDLAYDMISLYEGRGKEELFRRILERRDLGGAAGESYADRPREELLLEMEEAYGEIGQLVEEGSLFSEDIYQDYIAGRAGMEPVVKALCLHVSHDCNLSCRYCFAGEGEYKGDRMLMPYEVGRQAIDFLIARSGSRRNLEVDFFGGEPLMNFDVVRRLVAYARGREGESGKRFRFTLTTNGMLLGDEVADFLNREMSNVVLSIDGRKEVHDRMRPTRGGKGSYDAILPRLLSFAEARGQKDYYVRGTFTHENLDFSKDVLHLADLGFRQISVEPVVAPKDAPYAIREEDVPALCEEYDALAREMLRRRREGSSFRFFHFMVDLSGGPCVAKRLSGCGSGTEYLAVTPQGDLYPCHQFVGEEGFLMGNVFEGVCRVDLAEEFRRGNVYAKEACADCFAKFYCSGGCAANSYHFSGSVNGAYGIGCELQRKRLECAIMLKAAEAEDEEAAP